jgi:hypothetical protein
MVDRILVLKWAHLGRIRNPRDCEIIDDQRRARAEHIAGIEAALLCFPGFSGTIALGAQEGDQRAGDGFGVVEIGEMTGVPEYLDLGTWEDFALTFRERL